MVTETVNLRFFDVHTTVQSDSLDFIGFFRVMYQRFLVNEGDETSGLFCALFINPDNKYGQPVLVLDKEVWPLDTSGIVEAYAYDGILNSILARVKSHYLIHAAALSWENRGLILVADAGQGKTTLTLELVRRGFMFLSDEIAAIRRIEGHLDAFPRRLRVRPETLELLNFHHIGDQAPVVFGKYLVDIEDILLGSLVKSAEPSYLFLLDHQGDQGLKGKGILQGEFVVYVDHIDEDLLSEIRKIRGIIQTEPSSQSGFPIIKIKAAQKGQAILEVERVCADQGVHVLEISKRLLTSPSFYPQASIESIPQSQAVMGLLRQFMPGHHSALLAGASGGSATRLFLEIARMLEYTECYQLKTGPINQTADLISNLVIR